MSKRALVIAINGHRATVMLSGGEFRTMPTRGQSLVVGQECWLPERKRIGQGLLLAASGLVVVFSLVFGVPELGGRSMVPHMAGVVSLDINPSINLIIGTHQEVIGATGLDSAGRRLLQERSVVGTGVGRAVQLLTMAAARDGYLSSHRNIVIGGLFGPRVPDWFHSLTKRESQYVLKQGWKARVVSVDKNSPQLLNTLNIPRISVGRYLLWKDATGNSDWSTDQVQKMSLTRLIHPSRNLISSRTSLAVPGIHRGVSSVAVRTVPSKSISPVKKHVSTVIRSIRRVLTPVSKAVPSLVDHAMNPVVSKEVGKVIRPVDKTVPTIIHLVHNMTGITPKNDLLNNLTGILPSL